MRSQFERVYQERYCVIAGVDEVGVGAWAGPVVAAAVIFENGRFVRGVDDSKALTAARREGLFDVIRSRCKCFGVGLTDVSEIDRINIYQAARKAMTMAVEALACRPDLLLIDGQVKLDSDILQEAVVGGDGLSHSIACASIIAKVTRDRLMIELAKKFPDYGFERHKGYGTPEHQDALRERGVLPIHRKSYAPVRALLRENPALNCPSPERGLPFPLRKSNP